MFESPKCKEMEVVDQQVALGSSELGCKDFYFSQTAGVLEEELQGLVIMLLWCVQNRVLDELLNN